MKLFRSQNISRCLVLAVLLVGILLLPLSISLAQSSAKDLEKLIEKLKSNDAFATEDISSKLLGLPPPPTPDARATYEEFVERYQKYFDPLVKLYPAGTLSFNTFLVLKSFSGAKTTFFIPSWYLPYMLINAPVYDEKSIRYEKLSVTVAKKKVFGLRMRAKIEPMLKRRNAKQLLQLMYIEDINARLLGFSHAQLMLPLSKNVEPAKKFRYNAFLDWSKHKRYKMNDQISRPIELTNFCHARGGDYLTSDHPDFALHIADYDKKASRLTFFLWKKDLLTKFIGRYVAQEKGLPDFIFQIDFEKPK